MSDVLIKGPIGIRNHTLPATCDANEGHEHNYDHTTIVISGRVRVKYSYMQDGVLVEGESREFSSGETIFIKANVRHTIIALTDDVRYMCVFSHRDFDGIVCQTYVGNQAAYN